MSVTVTLEVTAKPESIDELVTMFTENFKQTRVYDGCIDVYMARSQDDANTLLLVEEWETRPHYERYLTWRAETGAVGEFASRLANQAVAEVL